MWLQAKYYEIIVFCLLSALTPTAVYIYNNHGNHVKKKLRLDCHVTLITDKGKDYLIRSLESEIPLTNIYKTNSTTKTHEINLFKENIAKNFPLSFNSAVRWNNPRDLFDFNETSGDNVTYSSSVQESQIEWSYIPAEWNGTVLMCSTLYDVILKYVIFTGCELYNYL